MANRSTSVHFSKALCREACLRRECLADRVIGGVIMGKESVIGLLRPEVFERRIDGNPTYMDISIPYNILSKCC
jgi:hypothetical protein